MIIGIRNQNVDKSPHLIYTVEVGDDIQPDLKHNKFVESSQYLQLLIALKRYRSSMKTLQLYLPQDIRLSIVRGREGGGARLCWFFQGWDSDP